MGCNKCQLQYIKIKKPNWAIKNMNENDIKSIRQKIRKGPSDQLLSIKPFATGMYGFVMVMISYYSRVREKLKIDYDSFMIIQTVVSHSLYHLNRKKIGSKSYFELEIEWEKLLNKNDVVEKVETIREGLDNFSNTRNNLRLTISSICLVTSLPKETVRRKVNELTKKNLLNISKKNGILLGSAYKKVFSEFTPQTTLEVSKLIKNWDKTGILKSILSFKI
jgi:hypothetical protein